MAKRKQATRLRFTEAELANENVARASANAERVADRADAARAKAAGKKASASIRTETDGAGKRKGKLRFKETEAPTPGVTKRNPRSVGKAVKNAPKDAALSTVHQKLAENEDGNVGVEAASHAPEAVKGTRFVAEQAYEAGKYSKKLVDNGHASYLQSKSDAANLQALYEKKLAEQLELENASAFAKWQQKQKIKKEYQAIKRSQDAAANAGAAAEGASSAFSSIGDKLSQLKDKLFDYVAENPQVVLIVLALGALLIMVSSSLSSCSAFLPGSTGAVVATTYTANDEDIIGANDDYKALESALQREIDNIESTYPGYDEYNYYLDEIGHDPYQLASYLTTMFEDFTRAEVQSTIHTLFDAQYVLDIDEEVEIRTRTETRTGTRTVDSSYTDPETGEEVDDSYEEEYEYEVEVEYEYYILNVTLTNKNLGHVITESGGMNDDQAERYAILNRTKGNKDYLFEGDPYVVSNDILIYDIPGEALTDTRFANMIQEAEKYLGYPYVWGGASPSTSFDCSGFVSYVINHCGNGWSVGRQTANGLKNLCSIIPSSSAQPGDLIFFQGTYNTSGASHVGIYVGGGMMIHCGNPIQYASINTPYWQEHFYCFGRLPN